MNSAGDKKMASTLTKLLRSELRDARSSITHLPLTDTEFVPNEHGGGTTSSNIVSGTQTPYRNLA